MMKSTLPIYQMYDLSNVHFRKTEVVTKSGQRLKGQFVTFRVVSGDLECLYPSEKYCFLPEANRKEFMASYQRMNGEFSQVPSYIKFFGLHEIAQIIIEPVMIE